VGLATEGTRGTYVLAGSVDHGDHAIGAARSGSRVKKLLI
jgi:hypothetical protein